MLPSGLQEDSTAYTVKCNIDNETNHLAEGIKLALKDDREKNSEQIGQLATFTGSSTITGLPPYLTVQMVRFFYKVQAAQKAKILRKVSVSIIHSIQAVQLLQHNSCTKLMPLSMALRGVA